MYNISYVASQTQDEIVSDARQPSLPVVLFSTKKATMPNSNTVFSSNSYIEMIDEPSVV